jgi:hypothetical protein
MTDRSIDLDERRGIVAQQATHVRRQGVGVKAQHDALAARSREFEDNLFAVEAATWPDAAVRARYLLERFAESFACEDPRLRSMVASVLDDFTRLSADHPG